MTMDYGKGAAAGSGGGSVLKIVNDLAKGSKMPTVNITRAEIAPRPGSDNFAFFLYTKVLKSIHCNISGSYKQSYYTIAKFGRLDLRHCSRSI